MPYVVVYITCPRCGHRNHPANNFDLAIIAIRKQLIPCKGKIDGSPCNAQLTADPSDFPASTLNRAYRCLGLTLPPAAPPRPTSRATFVADDHGTVWPSRCS